MWARAAHTGTDFSFTRKVSKSVSKRKYPLGNLLDGATRHSRGQCVETLFIVKLKHYPVSNKPSENGATRYSQGQCVGTLYIEKLKHCPVSSNPSENGATRHSRGQCVETLFIVKLKRCPLWLLGHKQLNVFVIEALVKVQSVACIKFSREAAVFAFKVVRDIKEGIAVFFGIILE